MFNAPCFSLRFSDPVASGPYRFNGPGSCSELVVSTFINWGDPLSPLRIGKIAFLILLKERFDLRVLRPSLTIGCCDNCQGSYKKLYHPI